MPVSERQAKITLQRLTDLLQSRFPEESKTPEWEGFQLRLEQTFPVLFRHMLELYGHHFDFFYHLERLLEIMAKMWLERSPELRAMDAVREIEISGRSFGPRKLTARTTSARLLLTTNTYRADIELWEGFSASLHRPTDVRHRVTKTEAISFTIE